MDPEKKLKILSRMAEYNTLRIASFSNGQLPYKQMEMEKELLVTEIKSLYRELRQRVKVEDYEEAADIRDKIKALAKSIGVS